MKKLDKKDLPKLVVLVALSVGIFGYALLQLSATPATKAATPVPAAAAGAALPGTPAAAGPAQKAGSAAPDTFDVAGIEILTSGKDPFVPNGAAAPQGAGDGPPASQAAKPAAPAAAAGEREPVLPNLMGLPSGGPAGGPPRWEGARALASRVPEAGLGGQVRPVSPPPPPAPDYVVTGVVRDETPDACSGKVAILRGGDGSGERRFVRCGDPVGNGFKVIAVRTDGVELQSGDRRVILKIRGGSHAK